MPAVMFAVPATLAQGGRLIHGVAWSCPWLAEMSGSHFSAANSLCCLKYSNPAKMPEVEDTALHSLEVPRAGW